jgi:hypothetical protein
MPINPDYEHDAHVFRTRSGWQRWHAECPCGKRWTGTGGKEDAERWAREHDGGRFEHTCYDPTTMEYDPGPCSACLAEDINPPAGDLMSAAAEIGEYLIEQLPVIDPRPVGDTGPPAGNPAGRGHIDD